MARNLKKIVLLFSLIIALGLIGGLWLFNGSGNLRGSSKISDDQKTYLIIADDNGGACESILVDNKVWPHSKNEAGPIAPGNHRIQCGAADSGIEFEITAGTTFSFDYWGP